MYRGATLLTELCRGAAVLTELYRGAAVRVFFINVFFVVRF